MTTMTDPPLADEQLYTTGEVARLFRVDPKTVARWAAIGRIASIRTPGGQRRFRESVVQELLQGETSAMTVTPNAEAVSA